MDPFFLFVALHSVPICNGFPFSQFVQPIQHDGIVVKLQTVLTINAFAWSSTERTVPVIVVSITRREGSGIRTSVEFHEWKCQSVESIRCYLMKQYCFMLVLLLLCGAVHGGVLTSYFCLCFGFGYWWIWRFALVASNGRFAYCCNECSWL